MIRHICMFKLKEVNKEQNIVEFMNRAQSLKSLKEVRKFDVVRNDKATPESNYDVALVIDFDSVEDLNAYQVSETHVEFGKFVGTVKELRACIDHEI